MAATQPSIQGEVNTNLSNRLVWVLNRDGAPYTANFQGMDITVPANSEKIPKHVRDGGNLMQYLDARHFITDLKQPQSYHTSPAGDRTPVFGPKALYDQALTQVEFDKIVGKKPEQMKKEAASEERKARKKLNEELLKSPVRNKIDLSEED